MDNTSYERGSNRWEEFLANAFKSVTEQVPVVIDVPHLLQDIFTLKGLIKQCRKLLLKLWKILSNIGAYGGHYANLLTLRKIMARAKDLSNGYLIYQFGVKPLIREVESLFGGTVSLLKRLDFLRRTKGSVFTARYSESVSYSYTDRNLGLADVYGFRNSEMHLRNIQGKILYTCTARIKNDLVDLDDLFAGVKLYLAGLGGNTAVVFLWDLVPFSFVVDWFANVSGVLEKYATLNPFGGELKVLSADTSFKKDCTADLTIEGDQLVESPIPYGTLRLQQYDRQPGLDCGLNIFSPLSSLTPHQLGILSALIIQRT